MKQRLLAAVLALTLGGCGSIADMATDQRIYGGIQRDVQVIGHPYLPNTEPPEYFFPMLIVGIFDVPLSLAADTLLLPVTVTIALTAAPKEEK